MSKMTRKAFLRQFRKGNPRTQKTTLRIVEGKVTDDNAAYVQDVLSYVAPDLTAQQLDIITSRTCSFGHLQDQSTRLTARCEVPGCKAVTCSTPGCSHTCGRCGRALCRRHVHLYDGDKKEEAYCTRCWPWVFFRKLVLG